MRSFLITRPKFEAEQTGQKIEAKGHRAVYAPMIQVISVSFAIPDDARSLIITSKNGARFGLSTVGNKHRPIFAVGEETAAEAINMGFTNVTAGPGTARGLIPLLLECGISQKRDYTHLSGTDISYDIAGALRDQGLDANHTVTYQAQPHRVLSPSVQEEMEMGEIDNVLFYSPRTATTFEETISELGRHDWFSKMNAYCLSANIAANLLGPWKSVNHSTLPTENALFKLFK